MKKLHLLVTVLLSVLLVLPIRAFAYDTNYDNYMEKTASFDAFSVEEVLIIDDNLRTSTRSATKTQRITFSGETIATVSLSGTFSYNGTTSSVVSKSVTKQVTTGWKYSQTSFTEGNGTIVLQGYVSKWLSKCNFTITLTCDANGNIS